MGIDCTYIIGLGLKGIPLNTNENKIIELLGHPFHISKFDEGQTVLYQYKFHEVNIDLFFHYTLNAKIDYVTLHTSSLIVDGMKIENLDKGELIAFFKKYHLRNKIPFKYKFSDNELDCSFDFLNLGVTIWFESTRISDIEISVPPVLSSM